MIKIRAIDIHGHFGKFNRGANSLIDNFHSGDIQLVISRAKKAGIDLTVVSALCSLMPYGGNVLKGNEDALKTADLHENILFWAVLNPYISESFSQVKEMISHPKCAGIKIHPVEHKYEIKDKGEKIFKFTALNKALVLTHSGDTGSFPEDFVSFANQYPEQKLILAHLGNSLDGNLTRQVLAIKNARYNNIYVDTSSMQSMGAGLIEWAVKEIGADKILFGSDTPLYFVASQKARIEYAEIPDKAKETILLKNACQLLSNKLK